MGAATQIDLTQKHRDENNKDLEMARIEATNRWFDLGKNIVWAVVVIAYCVIKLQTMETKIAALEEKNQSLSSRIEQYQNNSSTQYKELNTKLDVLQDKSTQLLILITKLTPQKGD